MSDMGKRTPGSMAADNTGTPGGDMAGPTVRASSLPPAAQIDARNLLCPLPVLRLRKALAALPPHAIVALIATDPAAVLDVPHFCAEAGHELLSSEPLPDGARRYLVRRG